MPDEGSVAVVEAPIVESAEVVEEPSTGEPTEQPEAEKQDNRKNPDALKKHIAELRRRADTITDPVEKKAELDRIKYLYDTSGKTRGYEGQFPTVREAREAKELITSFGGREGLAEAQATLSRVRELDQQLTDGNPAAAVQLWKEAPEGMVKLAPAIFSELEKHNPQEYAKAVVPHAIKFLDTSGFPEAFDQMVSAYQEGKKADADALALRLAKWVSSQRQTQQETKVDPNVERLQKELDERKSAESKQATDRAYNDVVTHAGPVIDKYLKPIVSKLGLSAEQYNALRSDTWKHLEQTRNADATYKTVANAKYSQGLDVTTAYIKSQTEDRAQEAARSRANFWYGHQLKNGAVKTATNATAPPLTPNVQRGKEPSPSEIDYSPKGIAVAKKQGFKDLSDMILAGKAPLKVGGIRQWR